MGCNVLSLESKWSVYQSELSFGNAAWDQLTFTYLFITWDPNRISIFSFFCERMALRLLKGSLNPVKWRHFCWFFPRNETIKVVTALYACVTVRWTDFLSMVTPFHFLRPTMSSGCKKQQAVAQKRCLMSTSDESLCTQHI